MAPYIYVSSGSPPTETTVSVVVGGLSLPANNYVRIEFYCSNGTSIRVESLDNGGTADDYRSKVATFTNLSPNTSYSFRAEIQRFSSSEIIHTGSINQSTTAPSVTVGGISTVYDSNILQTSFRLNWSAANNASSYQAQIRVEGTSTWSSYYTGSLNYTFSNLTDATYYEVRVRGYTGTTYGAYSSIHRVRTQSLKPSALNWSLRSPGQNFNLTAEQWNDFTSKINAWRVYQGQSLLTFSTATSGTTFTASFYNQGRSGLSTLNPPYPAPSAVSSGDTITAAKINALGQSIDSLI